MEYGTIKINVKELIEKKGISKSKFSQQAEMQRTQLDRYYISSVSRLDVSVLARICAALDCAISDILEYVPPEK